MSMVVGSSAGLCTSCVKCEASEVARLLAQYVPVDRLARPCDTLLIFALGCIL